MRRRLGHGAINGSEGYALRALSEKPSTTKVKERIGHVFADLRHEYGDVRTC